MFHPRLAPPGKKSGCLRVYAMSPEVSRARYALSGLDRIGAPRLARKVLSVRPWLRRQQCGNSARNAPGCSQSNAARDDEGRIVKSLIYLRTVAFALLFAMSPPLGIVAYITTARTSEEDYILAGAIGLLLGTLVGISLAVFQIHRMFHIFITVIVAYLGAFALAYVEIVAAIGMGALNPFYNIAPTSYEQVAGRTGLALGCALGIWLCVWRIRRAKRVPPGPCHKCGYDLTGNVSGRCPECGIPVNKSMKSA